MKGGILARAYNYDIVTYIEFFKMPLQGTSVLVRKIRASVKETRLALRSSRSKVEAKALRTGAQPPEHFNLSAENSFFIPKSK